MKLFSFNKGITSVFITLLFVVFFGALYFFIYLPQNEKVMQEQRFRTLQTIDKNIHEKIDNSVALLNNLLTSYLKSDSLKDFTRKYIESYPKELFKLTVPVPDTNQVAARQISDSGFIIQVNNADRSITLQFRKMNGADGIFYNMSMQLTFEQFIKFLLPNNVFDQYVVFRNEQVVYETFPSGITSIKDTSLTKSRGVGAPNVRSINAGGTDYKMFLQTVSFTPDYKWVLSGLLSNKRYQQEKNQLPPKMILFLVTAVLIIIVASPWIKLYQMGNKDRLTISDGIASIVVGMLLMSLLFFTFFKYNRYLRPAEGSDSKVILSDQITTSFQSEIESVYAKLKSADTLYSVDPVYFRYINQLHKSKNALTALLADKPEAIKLITTDTSIKQIFWLDETGEEVANWTEATMNAPSANYKNRDYFGKIQQHKEYILNNDPGKPYYLDQIISWTTGKFTSVISIPSVKAPYVAAMTFNFRSLDKPVLPTGYHFAMIDNAAKVLYHSDVSRNLNENLLTEFSAVDKLTSCLKARTSDAFKTKYLSKEYNVLFKPMSGLPYSIVIFSDVSYSAARDTEIYSFTISMMMVLFAILILQLLVVFLLSSKRSYFKKQLFDTTWIGPKISSRNQYNISIIFNLVIISLAILFFNVSAFLAYVYILLFSVTLISIFLNALFARKYTIKQCDNFGYKNNSFGWHTIIAVLNLKKRNYTVQQSDHYKFKINSLRGLIIFIAILNLTALKSLDSESTIVFFTYEFVSFIFCDIMYCYGNALVARIIRRFKKPLENWNYARSYTLMSLTRLIITSGIPVAFFYISSYNYEQNISIRYRQLQYADELIAKLSKAEIATINAGNSNFNRGYYYDNDWIKDLECITGVTPQQYSEEDSITRRILGMFRVNFTEISTNDNKFYISHASDSSFFYNPLLKDACQNNKGTITYRQTGIPGEYLKLSASSLNYKVPALIGPSQFNGFIFWLMLIAAMVSFYFIIYNIINKLFCLRLQDLSIWRALDEKILTDDKLNNLVFIIGLPGSGKLNRVKQKIRDGEMFGGGNKLILDDTNPELNNVFVVDLINIPDTGSEEERDKVYYKFIKNVFNPQNKLIIVNHFEYNIHDKVTNHIKLNFLEKLMLENKSKVIILSTIHPVAFLDSFIEHSALPKDQSISGEELERWHVLFGHFRIVVFHMEKSFPDKADRSMYAVYKETEHTHFLQKLQQCTLEIAEELSDKERASKADQLAFKLQVTAHYFYMYIWQSLTKEEKFLLYDLAEDNLVNSYDDYNLNMLLAKGVIMRPDGTLQLFNKGFRNFILTAIGNTEAMKIKNRIKDNGNWSRLKNPLLIVLLAILTFLLTFQEEAYSKVITYVAALGTGIPVVIKLLSFFDKSKPVKE